MKFLLRAYRIVNILNIDVAFGAVSSALFFIKLMGGKIEFIPLFLLFSMVWIVYTVDRLLDVRRSKSNFNTKRHQFHKQHKSNLTKAVINLIAINAVLTFWLNLQLIFYGLVVALIVFVYLLIQYKLTFAKEITICILYTIGCLLPAISTLSIQPSIYIFLLVIQFALTVFFNLLLFAWFDYESDLTSGSKSLVIRIGQVNSEYLLLCVFSLVLLLTILINNLASYLLLTATIVMAGMFVFKKYFELNDRFRLLGDAIFYILLLYLI